MSFLVLDVVIFGYVNIEVCNFVIVIQVVDVIFEYVFLCFVGDLLVKIDVGVLLVVVDR